MTDTRRETVVQSILEHRISAIIRTGDASLAADAMQAAVDGGFRMIEFTLTTPDSLDLIERFAAQTGLLVGAGTVLTTVQARDAVHAGARFIVSPICDCEVIAEAHALDVPAIPGTVTPGEMMQAHRSGADFVKLFPGPPDTVDYVRSVLGPLPFLRIFPTSGIDEDNYLDVLRAGAVGVGFVRPLFKPDDLARRDFKAIRDRAASILERFVDAFPST